VDLLERRLLLSVTFEPQQTTTVGTMPATVAVADLNGDGHVDAIVPNQSDNTVGVLLGNGNGTFQAQQTYPVGAHPNGVAVGDLNGDGRPDLVVVNYNAGTVSVLLGNGTGTFQAQQTYTVGTKPTAVVVAALGNGHDDIVVTNSGDNTVGVLLGNGDGTFGAQQVYAVGSDPTCVAVANLGNGHPDLIVTNFGGKTVGVLPGNGDGTFGSQVTYATGSEPYGVAVADLGNGHPDVVVANFGSNTISVLLGNGDGTLGAQQTDAVGKEPTRLAIADLGNGQPDVVVTNFGDQTLSLLRGSGNGAFQPQLTLATGNGPDDVSVADLGNGHPDLVLANYYDDDIGVLLGNGGDLVAFAQSPAAATAGQPLSPVTVEITNAAGTVQANDTSAVTLSIASGPGGAVLGGTATVAAVGGVATFSDLTLSTAGTYTLTAADTTDAAAVTSATFTIAPPVVDGTVTGTLFNDVDGNGTRSDSEAGLAGQTVYVDVDHSGTLTAGDLSAVTGSDGTYSIASVPAGTYTVRQVVPTGYTQTAPAGGGGWSVTVAAGSTTTVPPFGDDPTVLPASPLTVTFLSRAPARVIGGTVATVKLRLSNTEPATVVGSAAVTLYASTDGTLSTGTAVSTTAKYLLKVPLGRSMTISVRFAYPTSLPTGTYYLLAGIVQLSAGGGAATTQPAVGAASPTVAFVSPIVDLAVSLPATVKLKAGRATAAALTVTNHGNVTAAGSVTLSVYLSTTGAADASAVLLSHVTKKVKIAAGRSLPVRIPFEAPLGLSGTETLVAVLTSVTVPADDNAVNDTAVAAIAV
jgi:hypothetical protein